MTLSRARWGIIGPGGIAHRFAQELTHSATGKLAAVASRDPSRAESFAREYGDEVRACGSYDELFADPAIDAVYIATVHTEHVALSIRALEAGKHVICEKPMAPDHAGAMAILEAANRAQRYFAEGYMYRFHPQIARVVELIRQGAIGRVTCIEATFSFDADLPPEHRLLNPDLAGGGILDVGGYPLSAARLLAGAAEDAAFADPVELVGHGHLGASGVDEFATASLRFASGITAHISCGVRLQLPVGIAVTGADGRIEIPDPWIPDPTRPATVLLHRVGAGTTRLETPPAHQYALEADAVTRSSEALESPQIPWADSLGIARDLDSWRAAIGLQYPFERDDHPVPTASGRPLSRRPDAKMRYGRIPGIGLDSSRLIMGVDNQTTLRHMSAMMDDFVARGGNTFDTAYIYGGGRMEHLFGRWVANRGIRDEIVVVGKGAHTPHCTPEGIVRQLSESLDRLGLDRVDLYLMHRDDEAVPVGEFVDVLDALADAGRVGAYGGSNWRPERFDAANAYATQHGKRGFVVLSNHFGLAHALDVPWAGCVQMTDPTDRAWLERTNTVLLPWSSQARGFFARAHPDDTRDQELVRCYYRADNFARKQRVEALAHRRCVPPTAIALAYVLEQSFPTFPLIGPRTLEETRGSLAGLTVSLTASEVDWLDLRS